MPYQKGSRLPAERASRLGHLEVLKSDLVMQLLERFEHNTIDVPTNAPAWEPLPTAGDPLSIVFGVDGSLQVVPSDSPPHMALAFVKTALLAVDQYALSKLDKEAPNPFEVRDILAQSAQYHATAFPLRNVSLSGMRNYDAIRQIVYESLKDASLEGEPFETLKWLIFEKWRQGGRELAPFQCPHCEQEVATLAYDADEGTCSLCGGKLFVTDFLGFHQEMSLDSAPDSIAASYMAIHETLLLFTAVRYFWQRQRQILTTCLFVKDGPLSLYSQYAKLVDPIRRFLAFAKEEGTPIYMMGQEKTGRFTDHLHLIARDTPAGSLFVPDTAYISEQIQHRTSRSKSYGEDTNYGAKIFVKLSDYHSLVLSIPTGRYVADPTYEDLIGADNILATLPTILSHRHEGALLPIELAHSVASLATYPSVPILKIFAERARQGLLRM
jgi:hypothetical protein